ncbi:glycosyltransferase [Sediminibacterium soli]|uniref:glycosyltransferase n=1 Tax=Sediminibacterium soli TaxID=2698829 RepID=UPI00137963E9|nr:glycosyltransferase [Sediminibacterium soli]NCI45084.1 glycosyltransferase [Sediminibacterium soli]
MLVAPLDWGLGHATRCIPVIQALLGHGYEVVLAAENAQASLLQAEFPQLPCLPLQGYRVRYSRSRRWLPFRMLWQLPGLFRIIKKEHAWLDRVIDEHRIDLVISDNRYGLYSKKRPCIFITHQLTIKAPFTWLEKKLQQVNYRYINRFTACWIPDTGGENNLAGLLAHPAVKPLIPVRYIGLLSRFNRKPAPIVYDYCFLLSGPEPQRSILEKKVIGGLRDVPGPVLLVRGLPSETGIPAVPSNVTVVNHLPGKRMEEAIQQSGLVISRSGYTTVMELVSMQKKALLIPTPGQTEQEYLAARLHRQAACYSVSQEAFSMQVHLAAAKAYEQKVAGITVFDPSEIQQLLQQL